MEYIKMSVTKGSVRVKTQICELYQKLTKRRNG